MQNPPKIKSHDERLRSWGDPPDKIAFDDLFISLLVTKGIDVHSVANEIAYLRRTSKAYKFSSRRTLAREKTMHVPLESLPMDFPPIKLRIGISKNAFVTVERFLPGLNYKIDYSSSSSLGRYCLVMPRLPEATMVALTGKLVKEAVEGIPDNRPIINARCAGKEKIILEAETRKIRIEAVPALPERQINITAGNIQFSDNSCKLREVIDLDPDPMGKKMFDRSLIEYASIRVYDKMSPEGEDYILAFPHADSKRPDFRVNGFYRDVVFGCYLARARNVSSRQLCASMQAARMRTFNDDYILKRVGLT